MLLEKKAAVLLIQKRKTLAIAESCTGGLLAHRLTNIPGSSRFFKFGLVTYAYEAKSKLAGVRKDDLKRAGAVSEIVAGSLAQGVRKILKTDFGIGITGIAGPAGATKNKPLGLTFIAVNTAQNTICRKFVFKGTRLQIKQQATTAALRLLLERLCR